MESKLEFRKIKAGEDNMSMRILVGQQNDTVQYAAAELKKYITILSRGKVNPSVVYTKQALELPITDGIVLGTLEELSLDYSDVDDSFIDDVIDISIDKGVGYIAGSNARSILMGVYRYCTSAGCRFIRPGADGDYVPHMDIQNHSFTYRKKADYPFRGQAIEGAVSYEHVRDTIYWLPKIGMNMYMIEGVVPDSYMHKWYGHVGNTKLRQKGQQTDYQMLLDYVSLMEQDIKKTGIQLHSLGHGWMFQKLGEYGSNQQFAIKEEDKKYLALVNGKRDIMKGDTFYTHFCYSNPEARKMLVDILVEYVQKKPYIDFLHVWLADAKNNQCECEECQKMHPSDFYIMLLNEVDEALQEIGCDMRIVLSQYMETIRPPQMLKLNNPSRFLITSGIGQFYENGYPTAEFQGELPPYKRNQFKMVEPELRIKWCKEWKEWCGGIPCFIFEYRFWTDMYCDMGNMRISRETYRDMKTLKELQLQGCMSDQTHRMYMPTALPIIMMGETMFDTHLDYEEVVEKYFEGAFGKDGKECRIYLETLSDLLCPANFRKGGKGAVEEEGLGDAASKERSWRNNEYVAEKVAKIPEVIEMFGSMINKNISSADNEAQRQSWVYLKYHAKICRLFSYVLLAGAENRIEDAQARYYEMEEYLSEHEMEFHNAFDVFLFLRTVRSNIDLPAIPYYD